MIVSARGGCITDEEMDAQLLILRGEIAMLEGERARLEHQSEDREQAQARLQDTEEFVSELAGKIEEVTQ